MEPAVAFLITDVLSEALERGTGTQVRQVGVVAPAAGKTGTTNDGADTWFVGYTPDLVAGIWLGFDQPRAILKDATGGSLAAPVWGRIVQRVYQGGRKRPEPWKAPQGVVSRRVDPQSGLILEDGCAPRNGRPAREELFVEGIEPASYCPGKDALPRDAFPAARMIAERKARETEEEAAEEARLAALREAEREAEEKKRREEADQARLAEQKKGEEENRLAEIAEARRRAAYDAREKRERELREEQARLAEQAKREEKEKRIRLAQQKQREEAERIARAEAEEKRRKEEEAEQAKLAEARKRQEKERKDREEARELREREERLAQAEAEADRREREIRNREEALRAERSRREEPEEESEEDRRDRIIREEERRAREDEEREERADEEEMEVFAVEDLSGWWEMTNTIQSTNYASYKGLRLGYRVQLEQDGDRIVGRGQKWSENGRTVPSGGRTPITVTGTVDGRKVTLKFTEHGAKRTTNGGFSWTLSADRTALRGSFWSTAADTSGSSLARRMP